MSDRRPPELFVEYKSRDAGHIERKRYHHASTAHILAAVRRGVESGEIEGEVKVARNRLAGWNPVMEVSEPGPYLVVRIEGET